MQINERLSHISKIELDSREVRYHQTGFTEHGLITHITNSRNNIHIIIFIKVIYLRAYNRVQYIFNTISIFLGRFNQTRIIDQGIKYLEIGTFFKQRIIISLLALTCPYRNGSLHTPCRTDHDLFLIVILQTIITRYTGKFQCIIAFIIIDRL